MANGFMSALNIMGSFETAWEMGESVGRTAVATVKEVGSVAVETGKQVGGGFDIKGSLIGFQEGKAKSPELTQQEEAANKKPRINLNPESNFGKVAMSENLSKMVEAKRAELNPILGFAPSYRATVDEQGNVGEYYQAEKGRKESEAIEEQIKAQRETTVAQASGDKRPVAGANKLTDGEDRNMQQPG